MKCIKAALGDNEYPGRGIILGKSEDGKCAVAAYFIMGRSENSRNRVFVKDGLGIRTQAFDPAKLTDPSLIIYSPVKTQGNRLVVTNGDQTDTIVDFLLRGGTFEGALRTREYEPDAPNYTPRISGMIEFGGGCFDYGLSILKRGCGCQRSFFEYPVPTAGRGHLIHTYMCDGDPLPSFAGEPTEVAIEGGVDGFTEALWNSLNAANRVSLYVNYVDLATLRYDVRIINARE